MMEKNGVAAANMLKAFTNEISAYEMSGRITAEVAGVLIQTAEEIVWRMGLK